MAVCDGRNAVIRYASDADARPSTLYHSGRHYVCEGGVCRMLDAGDGAAILVASEPLSHDGGWKDVPPGHFVVIEGRRRAALVPVPRAASGGFG